MSPVARLSELAVAFESAAKRFDQTATMSNHAALKDIRLQIAEQLASAEDIQSNEWAVELSAIFATQRAVNLRCYSRSPNENAAFQILLDSLLDDVGSLRHGVFFAALLLGWHACEVGQAVAAFSLPASLRARWLAFAFETPAIMTHEGGAQDLAKFLDSVCHLLLSEMRRVRIISADLIDPLISSGAFSRCHLAETNLRTLMSARARAFENFLARSGFGLDQCLPLQPLRKRIRIGFVVLGPKDDDEGAYLAAQLKNLDHGRFDSILFSVSQPSGTLGSAYATYCGAMIELPEDLVKSVSQIRSHDLDIAVICDNVTSVFHKAAVIAAHRIARIQITTPASPVTTGFRNIDFMLTGQYNEPTAAAEQYSERLLILPGSASYLNLLAPGPGPHCTASRAEIGIPDEAVMYFSMAAYDQLHPRLLKSWIRILQQVPGSVLMLMPFRKRSGGAQPPLPLAALLRQICEEIGVEDKRIVLAGPARTNTDLQATIRMADVVLDSFPLSAAASVSDALRARIPLVARSESTSRGHHSAAILEEAGLRSWICCNDEDYIGRAVKLGTNPELRAKYKAEIDALGASKIPTTDTAAFSAKILAGIDALRRDWSVLAERIGQLAPDDLTASILALSKYAADRLGGWGDLDMLSAIVVPYLRGHGPGLMIDVGACTGYMSAPFLQIGWRAVMFEPDSRAHVALEKLIAAFPGMAHLEAAAVTQDTGASAPFHIAQSKGLSGFSASPFDNDADVIQVETINLPTYIERHKLQDVRFIKIDAEGYDLAIVESLNLSAIAPRLIMAEFGEHFGGQGRQNIEKTVLRMRANGYRACIFCLRATGSFTEHDWRTELSTITVDALPEASASTRMFGNVLFFPESDSTFLPSVAHWLSQLCGRNLFSDGMRRDAIDLTVVSAPGDSRGLSGVEAAEDEGANLLA